MCILYASLLPYTLEFYPARYSVTDKRLLNDPVNLIFDITDANRICLFREQIIYRLLLKMWLALILFLPFTHTSTGKTDYSTFLLQIADCDSGPTSIPESDAVAAKPERKSCCYSWSC